MTLNTHFLLDFKYFHETIDFLLTSVFGIRDEDHTSITPNSSIGQFSAIRLGMIPFISMCIHCICCNVYNDMLIRRADNVKCGHQCRAIL